MATLTLAPGAPRVYKDGANRRTKVIANTDDLPSNKGFVVNVDGTLSCRLRRETALDVLTVLAGVIYPLDVAQVDITGSTGPTTVWLLHNH